MFLALFSQECKLMDIPKFLTNEGNKARHDGLVALHELRNRGGAPFQDFGVVELSIPELDFAVITRRHPDMVSPDHEISRRAWDKFIRSSASNIYKTRSTNGKATKRLV